MRQNNLFGSLQGKLVCKREGISRFIVKWASATDEDDLISLLHQAWKNADSFSTEEKRSLIISTLEVADGHKEVENFCKDDNITTEIALSRQRVAKEAYQIACIRYFKQTIEDKKKTAYVPLLNLMKIVNDQELLNKLFWFFRPKDKDDFINVENRENPDERYDAPARAFVLMLMQVILAPPYIHRERKEDREKMINYINSYYGQVVDIVYTLGKCDMLLADRAGDVNLIIERLSKIVLDNIYYLPDYSSDSLERVRRKASSLEEIVWANEKGADVLLLLQLRKKMQEKYGERKRITNHRSGL